jgi:butyryl-CoA:acetate CoA-transferase
MAYFHLAEYRSKRISAAQAAALVKSGDYVEFGYCLSKAIAMDKALARRTHELFDVNVHCSNTLTKVYIAEADPRGEHFTYSTGHCSTGERPLMGSFGFYVPSSFGQNPEWFRRSYRPVDIVMIQTRPMDKHGYFNFGPSATFLKACCEMAKTVVVEVNDKVPRALGGREEAVHLSDVDYVVEDPEACVDYYEVKSPPITAVDMKIAEYVVSELEDGACLQLGIGGMPNAVGKLIAQSELKDLGIHTEMLCDAMLEMHRAGKVTGRRKTNGRGKIVYTFALGSRELYDFIDDNPTLAMFPVDYTNSLRVISQNERAVSINSAIEVDLTGQVCSESVGTKHISGSGGQLEFHWGAYLSPGGKAFICISSTYEGKKGETISRIKPILTPGGVVTTPRPTVNFLVTEHGKVNLKGQSTWERAERIISIAHPDFRDELVREAEKLGIWKKSNKRDRS